MNAIAANAASVSLRGIAASGGDRTNREVREVLERQVPAFARCYEDALASDPTLAGSISTTFNVRIDGMVEAAQVSHPNASFGACLNRVLAAMQFHRSVEETFVNVTIVLDPPQHRT